MLPPKVVERAYRADTLDALASAYERRIHPTKYDLQTLRAMSVSSPLPLQTELERLLFLACPQNFKKIPHAFPNAWLYDELQNLAIAGRAYAIGEAVLHSDQFPQTLLPHSRREKKALKERLDLLAEHSKNYVEATKKGGSANG